MQIEHWVDLALENSVSFEEFITHRFHQHLICHSRKLQPQKTYISVIFCFCLTTVASALQNRHLGCVHLSHFHSFPQDNLLSSSQVLTQPTDMYAHWYWTVPCATTTARLMVCSQQSACLLVIASSDPTAIVQQFASRLTYPSAPRRLLQASNWAQLRPSVGMSFSPLKTSEVSADLSSPHGERFRAGLGYSTDMQALLSSTSSKLKADNVCLHCLQNDCCFNT